MVAVLTPGWLRAGDGYLAYWACGRFNVGDEMNMNLDPVEILDHYRKHYPFELGKELWLPYEHFVMGAVLRQDQIAETFYRVGNELVRITVTVAEVPPHVLYPDPIA